MITLRCPTCMRTIRVRAGTASCTHAGTLHDAKRVALMAAVDVQTKVPA